MGTKIEELDKMARGEGVLGRAVQDEPLFFLRAQDVVAPAVVKAWCHLVREEASGLTDLAAKARTLAKADEAWALSERMEAWQEANHAKLPD